MLDSAVMVSLAPISMNVQTVTMTALPMLIATIMTVDLPVLVTLVTLVTVKTVSTLMNALTDQTAVMLMPHVSTLMVVTHVHAMLDTEVMVNHALTWTNVH